MQQRGSQQEFPLLLRRLEERQRRGLLGAVIGLLVAAAIAGVIVWFSYVTVADNLAQVTELRRELAQVQSELAQAEKEKQVARAEAVRAQEDAQQARQTAQELRATVEQVQTQVRDLEKRVRESTNFIRFIHPIDWTEAKSLASRYPDATGILLALSDPGIRSISWKLGGRSPQEGFDSPGFAAYLLCSSEVLPEFAKFASQEALRVHFRSTSEPRVGDLALFEGGFTMFFLMDRQGKPFVVGMTVAGVAALEMQFARSLGFLRVAPPPSRLGRCAP